jgi:hypothetical protein
MKYAHIVNGKVVNFIEWDGKTPLTVEGSLRLYQVEHHEPACIPKVIPPTRWQTFKEKLLRHIRK